MHGAELRYGGVGQRLNLLRLRDVGFHGNHFAEGRQAGNGLVHFGLIDVRDDNLHAFFQEALGKPEADARRAAGNHGHAALEFFHLIAP